MSEIGEFREYVEEQRNLCYGVEGTTPGVHGRIARQYDFLLETIDTYQEIEQPQLSENQQMVLDELKINTDYQKFNKFQSVFWLLTTIIQYPDTLLAKAYKELTQDELDLVFQVFSQWAH